MEAVGDVNAALLELHELGFKGTDEPARHDPSSLSQAHGAVLQLVHHGEELLLLHKRLVVSGAAYGFLHQHDVLEHWERYAATGRIFHEINQLIDDVWELLGGYREIARSDGALLVDDLDLPADLLADFALSRNLFSVGFDDVAVLIAGRGLAWSRPSERRTCARWRGF